MYMWCGRWEELKKKEQSISYFIIHFIVIIIIYVSHEHTYIM